MKDNTLFEKHIGIFDGNIELYYCGKRVKTKNHSYGPEIRSHFLIVFVQKGSAVFYRNGKETIFSDNDMLVMFPGEKIYYRAESDWSIKWIGVKGDKVEEIFKSINVTRENSIFSPKNHERLSEILTQIYDIDHDCSILSKCKAQSLLYSFFSELLSGEKQTEKIDYIADAVHIMKYNYDKNLNIHDISDRFFLNQSYFTRKFKEEIGVSPNQYLLNLRLEAAKKLLRTTKYSIKEITFSVGFKDPLYFSRLFSKKEHMTPSAYRTFSQKNIEPE